MRYCLDTCQEIDKGSDFWLHATQVWENLCQIILRFFLVSCGSQTSIKIPVINNFRVGHLPFAALTIIPRQETCPARLMSAGSYDYDFL